MNKMSMSEAGKLGYLKSEAKLRAKVEQRISNYLANPRLCLCCQSVISYDDVVYNKKIFCSHSCSAKHNNTKRSRHKNTKSKLVGNCKLCDNGIRKDLLYCSRMCHKLWIWKSQQEEYERTGKGSVKFLKRILIERYGLRCMMPDCGWDWTKPCTIELDHIDGNSDNNALSNLRLICPNCHTQTSTYKGRNAGHGRHSRRQRYKNGQSY